MKRTQLGIGLVGVEQVEMRLRVGFGPEWVLAQKVQDIAEHIGVILLGGSAESGQLFYSAKGNKIGEFRAACAAAGFIASFA
jgi:hypothetical protein